MPKNSRTEWQHIQDAIRGGEEILDRCRPSFWGLWDESIFAEALEFLKLYAGEESEFYRQLKERKEHADIREKTENILKSYIHFLEKVKMP